jgi:hypothetical protein
MKDESLPSMLKKRDSRLPAEKWDKSSKKADISEVFFVSSGSVGPSSSQGNVVQRAIPKRTARNAAAAATGRGTMLKSTWQRSLAMGIFGVVGASLAFAAGARIGSGLDHQTRTVSVARIQIQQLQQPHDDAPPAQVARQ